MALAGYKALVKAQSSAVTFTSEATTTADDTIYQITNTSKRIFDYATDVTVKDSAVATTEAYTLNKINGTVTFESVDAGRVITLDGKYVTLTTVAEAKGFNFEGSCDMGDVTVFQDESRAYTALLLQAKVTLEKFYTTDNYFLDALNAKEVNVIELYPDSSDAGVIRVYGAIDANSVTSAIEGLVEESVSLQCTDRMITDV